MNKTLLFSVQYVVKNSVKLTMRTFRLCIGYEDEFFFATYCSANLFK